MRRRASVTIRDVAAHAGLSLQTVSRVINDEPNVRPETAERVRGAIQKLGYVPSTAAQRMAGARSYLILALNDRARTLAQWRERQGVDWIDQMLLGGMTTCAKHGYRMMVELIDTHSARIEGELLAAVAALRPDGVVLTPPHSQNQAIMAILQKHGIATVRIGSIKEGLGFRLSMDDEEAARLATSHLLELGHRRIGMIKGLAQYELSGRRVKGWRQAMKAADLSTESMLIDGRFTHESGRTAALRLLDLPGPPTAIIASNDLMAMGTLAAARERNLRVPQDLSVISFDDTPVMRYTDPPMTAITQPIAAITSRAVELIVSAMRNNQEDSLDVVEMFSGALTIRQSTAPPLDHG